MKGLALAVVMTLAAGCGTLDSLRNTSDKIGAAADDLAAQGVKVGKQLEKTLAHMRGETEEGKRLPWAWMSSTILATGLAAVGMMSRKNLVDWVVVSIGAIRRKRKRRAEKMKRKRLGRTVKMLAVMFAVLAMAVPVMAQDEPPPPPPMVEVTDTADLEGVTGPVSFLDKIGSLASVNAGYAWLQNGEQGSCIDVHLHLASIRLRRTELSIGPDFLFIVGDEDRPDRWAAGGGIQWRVVESDQVQAAYNRIPFLRKLPLNVGKLKVGVAAGTKVDNEPRTFIAIYAGGIEWGN